MQYPEHPHLTLIQGCRFKVTEGVAPTAIPLTLAGQKGGKSLAAGPGQSIEPETWTAKMIVQHGKPTAVLIPMDSCRYQRVLAYSSNTSGIDPEIVRQAGFAIQMACRPEEEREKSARMNARMTGPAGHTILIGLTRRYQEGTFQHIGTYDWEAIRVKAVGRQTAKQCHVRTHEDIPVPPPLGPARQY